MVCKKSVELYSKCLGLCMGVVGGGALEVERVEKKKEVRLEEEEEKSGKVEKETVKLWEGERKNERQPPSPT